MEASCIAAQLVGSDEATSYLSNKINHHNTEIWEVSKFPPSHCAWTELPTNECGLCHFTTQN